MLNELRTATIDARTRTGDGSISTRVSRGRFQVVRVTYRKSGVSDVAELSDWLSIGDAIDFLCGL